jgi:hypothetical protein
LVPIVIEMAGSSTVMSGRGRGSSTSARVSPMVISGMPATAMMSPGPALSAGLALQGVGHQQLGDLDLLDGRRRHQATCWPLRIVPLWTRAAPGGRGSSRRRGW